MILLAPALDLVPSGAGEEVHISVRWPLQLMVGAGLVFTSLTVAEWWTLGVLALGLVIGLPALARIVPAGTFRLRPGCRAPPAPRSCCRPGSSPSTRSSR